MHQFIVGWDCGKTTDSPALMIIEEPAPALGLPPYRLRHLQRLPLGMPYPIQVDYVLAMLRRPQLAGRCELVVDATGGGIVVCDMLEAAGALPICVSSHGGVATKGDEEQRHFGVSKTDLVAAALRVIEGHLISAPRGMPEWPQLVLEVQNFVRAPGKRPGRYTYGAVQGQHDDVLMAFALACWRVLTRR